MTSYIINSPHTLQEFIGEIREDYLANKILEVDVKKGKDRSSDQNKISHAWYAQIHRENREHSVEEWKSICKLVIGVPILRADDEEFRKFYDASLKLLPYEDKVKAMEFVPVTSIMKKPQMATYLTNMQEYFFKNYGIILESTNEF